ncbi:hypothetical protein JL721_8928 [Aureococcus anophagefferens]|nr:hypothetical protein JL721_8928 [Aureococcus anophagefferens]
MRARTSLRVLCILAPLAGGLRPSTFFLSPRNPRKTVPVLRGDQTVLEHIAENPTMHASREVVVDATSTVAETVASIRAAADRVSEVGRVWPTETVLRDDESLDDALSRVVMLGGSGALPVVDGDGALVGALTPSEIMVELERDATEDVSRMAGTGTTESYFGAKIRDLVHPILMLFLARRAASLRPAITGRAWRALSSSPFDEDFLLPKGGDGPAPARAERRPSNRYGEGRRDRSRGGVPAEGSWTKRNEGRAFERTRLFVSALDPGTRWQELKDHFRDGGFDVIYASVSTDRYTGESKGCGIVQLATEAEAEAAIGRDGPVRARRRDDLLPRGPAELGPAHGRQLGTRRDEPRAAAASRR